MDMGELVTHFGADTKQLNAALIHSKRQVKKYETQTAVTAARTQKNFRKMGRAGMQVKRILMGLGVLGLATGLGATLAMWTRQTVKFQTKFTEVKTLFDTTKYSAKELQQGLISLSGAYGTMEEKAASLYQVISAGIDVLKSVEFLGQAAKFSKAGVTDLESSVDLLTTAINSYGMAASKVGWVSDILFETIKRGKTTAGELAGSFGRVLGTAAAIGVTFKELNAAVAALTASGIKTTETMSGLKQVFANIAKPQGKALETAKALGLEFGVVALRTKGLKVFLDELIVATKGNTQAQVDMFGSVEAFNSIAILASEAGSKRFTEALVGMGTAAGNTFTALEKFKGTFSFEWDRLWNNMAKSLTGMEEPFGNILKNLNDAIELQDQFFAMLQRNGGTNAQQMSIDAVTGPKSKNFASAKLFKEFSAYTVVAENMNRELSKAFNKTGSSIEKVYTKYGDLVQMLVPQMKKFGIVTTDGMARIMDYTKMLKDQSDMIYIVTKSGIPLSGLMQDYADDIVRMTDEYKTFTNEALDPVLQKARETALAFIALRDAVKKAIPTTVPAPPDWLLGIGQYAEIKPDFGGFGPSKEEIQRMVDSFAVQAPSAPAAGSEISPYGGADFIDTEFAQLVAANDNKIEEERRFQKFILDLKKQAAANETALAKQQHIDVVNAKKQMLNDLASLMNTNSRTLFKIGKAAAIAEAIIQGHLAASKSFATLGGAANPMAWAAAAASYTAAANIVANIASTSFGGGGGAGISASMGASGVYSGTAPGFGGSASSQTNDLLIELAQAVQALHGVSPGQVVVSGYNEAGGLMALTNDSEINELSNEITGSVYV